VDESGVQEFSVVLTVLSVYWLSGTRLVTARSDGGATTATQNIGAVATLRRQKNKLLWLLDFLEQGVDM